MHISINDNEDFCLLKHPIALWYFSQNWVHHLHFSGSLSKVKQFKAESRNSGSWFPNSPLGSQYWTSIVRLLGYLKVIWKQCKSLLSSEIKLVIVLVLHLRHLIVF